MTRVTRGTMGSWRNRDTNRTFSEIGIDGLKKIDGQRKEANVLSQQELILFGELSLCHYFSNSFYSCNEDSRDKLRNGKHTQTGMKKFHLSNGLKNKMKS